jgi:hypothetical protein
LFACTQSPQVPAEAKPKEVGEGVEEDEAYSINTNEVSASVPAPVAFTKGTPELRKFASNDQLFPI